jgi:hypothetical protein
MFLEYLAQTTNTRASQRQAVIIAPPLPEAKLIVVIKFVLVDRPKFVQKLQTELHVALYFQNFGNYSFKFQKNLKKILDVDNDKIYVQNLNVKFFIL